MRGGEDNETLAGKANEAFLVATTAVWLSGFAGARD
jgi:hypothetical protein